MLTIPSLLFINEKLILIKNLENMLIKATIFDL